MQYILTENISNDIFVTFSVIKLLPEDTGSAQIDKQKPKRSD